MSLSSFLKKNLMREGQLLFVIEDEEEEEKKKVPRMIDGISINRGKLRKNSRLGFYQKKKVHTKLLPSTASSQQERTTKRALEGVRVCVCVCVDLESKQHIHTHERKKWRQTGCLEEETPPRVVLSVTQPKEIITF